MRNDFNDMTEAEAETLACLSEEAGEIVQIVAKALRHGLGSCHPDGGETNRENINKEVGDLLAIVSIAVGWGMLDADSIESYRRGKLDRIERYLHHAKVPEGAS